MVTSYKKTKEDVLSIYDEFLKFIDENEAFISTSKAEDSAESNGAEKSKKNKEWSTSLAALAKQAERIRDEKFCLMIAGEAKSGKSTFINAYLHTEILPMDVKQCTSSVVEIKYGEVFKTCATYADGREEVILGDEKIHEFLIANAAIDDEYRDIPTTWINNDLIVPKKGARIPESEIVDVLNQVKSENIHRLPENEYNAKIRKYIKEKQADWKNIVVKMVIEYPFADTDMRGVQIVDSPGVNAAGKVGDVSAEYIKDADAIMFLRPITGVAIEAESFKKFLESKSVDRNKNALFLILTRKAAESESSVNTAYEEFVNLFAAQSKGAGGVAKEQIIPVDSKAELYFNMFSKLSTEEIGAKLKKMKEANESEPFLRCAWADAFGDREEFLKELKKYSNFEAVSLALNSFGRKAQFLALSEFLARVIKVYSKMLSNFKEQLKYYEMKAEDPEKLALAISQTKKDLILIQNKMNQIVDDIVIEYSGKDGTIVKDAEEYISKYNEYINEIDGTCTDSLNKLETRSLEYVKKFTDYEKKLQESFFRRCNEALVDLSNQASLPSVELEPDLTEEAISKIKEEMKEAAQESYTYTTGKSFNKATHTGSRFSQYKFYGLVKTNINERISNIKQQVIADLSGFVQRAATVYTTELRTNADEKERQITEIEQRKQTAEEMAQTISALKQLIEQIEPTIKRAKEHKGGIDGHV